MGDLTSCHPPFHNCLNILVCFLRPAYLQYKKKKKRLLKLGLSVPEGDALTLAGDADASSGASSRADPTAHNSLVQRGRETHSRLRRAISEVAGRYKLPTRVYVARARLEHIHRNQP
jgi:hypothetical protein